MSYEPNHILLRSTNYLFSGYSAILALMSPGFIFYNSLASGVGVMVHLVSWGLLMVGFWLNATQAPNLNYFSVSSVIVVTLAGTFQVFTGPLILSLLAYLGLFGVTYLLKNSYLARLDFLSVLYSVGIGIFLVSSSVYLLLGTSI